MDVLHLVYLVSTDINGYFETLVSFCLHGHITNLSLIHISNPEHRKMVQKIAEHTAKHFDEFSLDDLFFTSCKCDIEIKAKGCLLYTSGW